MMHWITPYIGLPYRQGGRARDGLDCWGFLRLVYLERFSIELPELPGITGQSMLTIAREVRDQMESEWVELDQPKDGCAVALSQRSAYHHVGLWVDAGGGKIVHSWKDHRVIAETWRQLQTKGFKVRRFFQHGFHHRVA